MQKNVFYNIRAFFTLSMPQRHHNIITFAFIISKEKAYGYNKTLHHPSPTHI